MTGGRNTSTETASVVDAVLLTVVVTVLVLVTETPPVVVCELDHVLGHIYVETENSGWTNFHSLL